MFTDQTRSGDLLVGSTTCGSPAWGPASCPGAGCDRGRLGTPRVPDSLRWHDGAGSIPTTVSLAAAAGSADVFFPDRVTDDEAAWVDDQASPTGAGGDLSSTCRPRCWGRPRRLGGGS